MAIKQFMSLLCVACGLIGVSHLTFAQSAQEPIPLETIVVESKVPVLYYKHQFEQAELDFYELYNSFVDEDKFKMRCSLRRMTGSHIKRTYCYPQYLLNQSAQASSAAMSNTDPSLLRAGIIRNPPSAKMIEFLSTRDRKASLIYAEELIKKHPALYQQLLNMHKAEQLYLNKKAQHNQKK